MELLESLFPILIPVTVFGAVFACSLFACKTWITRMLFIIVMPLIYGFIWFLSMVILGCVAMISPSGIASILDELAFAIAICISLTVFIVHVTTMSKDNASASNYVFIPRGNRKHTTSGSALPHLVTQRRIMRR